MFIELEKYEALLRILESYEVFQKQIKTSNEESLKILKQNENSSTFSKKVVAADVEIIKVKYCMEHLKDILEEHARKAKYIEGLGKQISNFRYQKTLLENNKDQEEKRAKYEINRSISLFEQIHQYGYMVAFVAYTIISCRCLPFELEATMDFQKFSHQKEQALSQISNPSTKVYYDMLLSALPFSPEYQELTQSKQYTR